ncbi:aspartic peptidase domain-containing protein [Tribonema minus]|uniref:Aspartic peptidase domain-containing protein n=1 Tax=Tribonema minus TaxID=303371 RepID=A0A835ZFV3_9STRA|nr:aspartic peptidase domain-containing protein [Tribonema minus]
MCAGYLNDSRRSTQSHQCPRIYLNFPLFPPSPLIPPIRPPPPQLGVLSLANYFNNQYVGTISVGLPAQDLTVVLDTGSSDLWIPGWGCTLCGNHATFDGTRSLTYRPLMSGDSPRLFEIDYGSGAVRGTQAMERVSLGGLVLEDVAFGEVLYEDQQIRNFMMDGIAGLGFSGLSIITRPTLLDLLRKQHADLPALFSVYLSTDPHDASRPSHLAFGGFDLDIVSANATWHYTPVVRQAYGELRYWTVKVTGVGVVGTRGKDRGRRVMSQCPGGCLAIVDTGTSGIAVPEVIYGDLVAQVTKGLNCRGTQCIGAKASDFPDLVFSIYPDNVFPLRNEDYVVCTGWGQCLVKLQPSFGGSYWILGDTFLQAYYAVFDVDNLRVGFACEGTCQGGTWHGKGGLLELEEAEQWRVWVLAAASVLGLVSAAYLAGSLIAPFTRRRRPQQPPPQAQQHGYAAIQDVEVSGEQGQSVAVEALYGGAAGSPVGGTYGALGGPSDKC